MHVWIGRIGWKSIEMMPGRIGWIGWSNWSNWVEIHWDDARLNQSNWVEIHWDDAQFDQALITGWIGLKSMRWCPIWPGINYWSNWVVELVKLGGNPLRLCLVELGGQIGWKSIEIMPGWIGWSNRSNWVKIHWDYAQFNQALITGRIGQIGWKSIEIMPGQIGWIGWLNWSNWVEIHWDDAWSNWVKIHEMMPNLTRH